MEGTISLSLSQHHYTHFSSANMVWAMSMETLIKPEWGRRIPSQGYRIVLHD